MDPSTLDKLARLHAEAEQAHEKLSAILTRIADLYWGGREDFPAHNLQGSTKELLKDVELSIAVPVCQIECCGGD